VELRALTDHSVHSGYFDNFSTLADKAANLDTLPEVAGIYVTLNTVDPALLSRRANRVKMNLGRKDPTTSDLDVLSGSGSRSIWTRSGRVEFHRLMRNTRQRSSRQRSSGQRRSPRIWAESGDGPPRSWPTRDQVKIG
jgi:hypothetical protein